MDLVLVFVHTAFGDAVPRVYAGGKYGATAVSEAAAATVYLTILAVC